MNVSLNSDASPNRGNGEIYQNQHVAGAHGNSGTQYDNYYNGGVDDQAGQYTQQRYEAEQPPVSLSDPNNVGTTLEYLSSYAIPQSLEDADSSPLPMGVLLSPAIQLNPPPPTVERSPIVCSTCGAHLCLYSKVMARADAWTCTICRKNQSFDGRMDAVAFERCPELTRKVVEYVLPSTSPPIESMPPPVIFVVDASAPQESLKELRLSIASVLPDLHPATLIGLITFSSTVALYDLTKPGLASANVIEGEAKPTTGDIKFLLHGHSGVGVSPLADCEDNLLDCLEAISAAGKEQDSDGEKLLKPRCIGAGVAAALSIVRRIRESNEKSPTPFIGSSIVVCTSGACDFGPGASSPMEPITSPTNKAGEEYMLRLGNTAADFLTTVNVFCSGMQSFCVPVLRKLVVSTGGAFLLEPDFSGQFTEDLRRSLTRVMGYEGELEVRVSEGICISRVIGSLAAVTEEEVSETGAKLKFRIPCVKRDMCLTLYFRPEVDIPSDYVHFQFSLTYKDPYNRKIRRVSSRRVRTTGNMETYLSSIDLNVVTVLIAKRSVLMATKIDSISDVLEDLDDQVKSISEKFGRKESSADGNDVYHLPPSLSPLPSLLFHLRRGPLLGPILQHPDDIACIRLLFLSSSVVDALRLIRPSILSFNSEGAFEELPLEVFALQSNRILMMDTHTDIFVWSGKDVCGPEFDIFREACVSKAVQTCEGRLPSPRILQFTEGSSASRWLACRLIPSHKDHESIQEANFPQLRSMPEDQRKALTGKFLPTDELSFVEYYLGLWRSE